MKPEDPTAVEPTPEHRGDRRGAGVEASPSAENNSGPASLALLVHHCAAALAIADRRGDRFLRYMLSMTLVAARQQVAAAASSAGEKVGEPVGLGP